MLHGYVPIDGNILWEKAYQIEETASYNYVPSTPDNPQPSFSTAVEFMPRVNPQPSTSTSAESIPRFIPQTSTFTSVDIALPSNRH
ncbi:hypothetical protein SK128_019717 [Halocaridina rubra]|uniref:Uncharacterized protein n=1 Tax=Halocaridina rubra TaxID=373956 RepID=A0AAN8W8P4_HALRR